MRISDILRGKKLNSNIRPINRIGYPVQSAYTRAAQTIKDPSEDWGLLGTKGNIAAGLTSAIKSGLGMYGTLKDLRAEQAYNDALALQAAQDREDKLAQQAFENDYKDKTLAQQAKELGYKERALAQQAALAREQMEAEAAKQANQFAQQKEMEAIKNQYATELQKAQTQAALDAEMRKREAEQDEKIMQNLDPVSRQKYIELKKAGQSPVIVDNKVGTIGKFLGNPKYTINEKDQNPKTFELPTNLPLGFGGIFNINRTLENAAQKSQQKKAQQAANRAAMEQAWGN